MACTGVAIDERSSRAGKIYVLIINIIIIIFFFFFFLVQRWEYLVQKDTLC